MEQDQQTVVYKEISRQINLDFSIEDIISAFESVVQASDGKFVIEDKNLTFNTFTVFQNLSVILGGKTCILRVKLEKIDDNKTKLTGVCDVSEKYKKAFDVYIDKFLMLVGRGLQGAEFTENEINGLRSGNLGSGCLGVLVFCALLLLAVFSRFAFAGS